MKKLFSLLVCGCILFGQMAFTACNNEIEHIKLPVPQNFVLETQTITWDEVPHATGYALIFENAESEVSAPSFKLPDELEKGNYELRVLAIGDMNTYEDSDWTSFQFSFPKQSGGGNSGSTDLLQTGYDEMGFHYTLLPDRSGYKISRGTVGEKIAGTLTIPSSFHGLPVKHIADYAFFALSEDDDYASANLVRSPFTGRYCNTITTEIILPSTIEEIGQEAFACMTNVEEIVLPDSVKVIENGAFWGCVKLKHVKFPSGLKEISDECFKWCDLEEVELPSGLETIGYNSFRGSIEGDVDLFRGTAFPTMHHLKSIVIPASVKNISSYAFADCIELENITFLPKDEDIETLDGTAFDGTKWISAQPNGFALLGGTLIKYTGTDLSVTIPGTVKQIASTAFQFLPVVSVYIPDGVKLIGMSIFNGCSDLTQIRLPDDLTELPDFCFSHDTSLDSIQLPGGLTKIGEGAFGSCSALTTVQLPDGVTEIGHGAFSFCSALTAIRLPSGLTKIGTTAFEYCSALTAIELPDGVTEIGDGAFWGTSIEKIRIPHTVTELGKAPFPETMDIIFYEGTRQEWNALKLKHNTPSTMPNENAHPFYGVAYFLSEDPPETAGNYWRYVDGVPTIWE